MISHPKKVLSIGTLKIKTVGNVNNVDGMANSVGYEKLSYLGLHSFPKSITQSVKTN